MQKKFVGKRFYEKTAKPNDDLLSPLIAIAKISCF